MKKATRRIVEKFPQLEYKLNTYENISLEEALKGVDEVQSTFLKLAWFFEEPEGIIMNY
jgi:hypothetical protein